MFLSKIKDVYTRNEGKNSPMPMVMSIPSSYGELEKETIKILCNRLNINLLSLIPESLSVSICYGYENNTSFVLESDKKSEYLLIIDIGYLYMNLTISEFERV